ncbi:DUF2946 family protein [Thiomonas sp.]|jgi:hypothetical protein|uniref:DUF2946 family protein n=1 Tax=Thiomonas sp. TaxID=2047785 RepID=UPI00261CAA17|nr:DUF2946 family protein [Thiomonas sp.]
MDAAVVRAMARWPNVPRCTGWLALDQRGQWWLRDQVSSPVWPRRADGLLDKTGAGPVLHTGLAAFIGRNYAADPSGTWYVQNGPQRVDVTLETAPWILRLQHDAALGWQVQTHTGANATPAAVWLDAQGRIWMQTSVGPGLLHSNDVPLLAAHLDAAGSSLHLPGAAPLPVHEFSGSAAERFGFQPDPPA